MTKEIVDERGKLRGKNHDCWRRVSGEMNGTLTPNYAYLLVHQDRHNLNVRSSVQPLSSNVEDGTLSEELNSNVENIITLSPESCVPNDNDSDNGLDTQNFKVRFSGQEWKGLLEEKCYKRSDERKPKTRTYTVLKGEWTQIFAREFHAFTRLPCNLSFKRHKICPDGLYFTCVAQCTTCRSTLTGVADKPPLQSGTFYVTFTYTGYYKECNSSTKRRITGNRKTEYVSLLQSKSAALVRRMEAREVMQFGEAELSDLPTASALRVLKCRAQTSERYDIDLLNALFTMKAQNNAVQDFGLDRFFLHYWSVVDINLYRLYDSTCRKNKTPTVISIDCTGGVAHKFMLPTGRKTRSIFLYQIAVNDRKNICQFSAGNMLSERHDNHAIAYWLSQWIHQTDVRPPEIVVMDQSLALMIAAAKAFTQYNFTTYLDVCWSLLEGKTEVAVPSCMLRNDVAHVMKLISTWPEFKSCHRHTRSMYLKFIALVVQCKEYEESKRLLKAIFDITLHTDVGVNSTTRNLTEAAASLQYLQEKVANLHPPMDNDPDVPCDNDDLSDDDDRGDDSPVTDVDLNSAANSSIRKIYEECKSRAKLPLNKGEYLSAYYNEDIAERIINFCNHLPCWSAIMVPIFQYGHDRETSSSSESLFKDIKKVIFKNLPTRIDKFVKLHTASNEGVANLTRAQGYNEEDVVTEDLVMNETPSIETANENSPLIEKTAYKNWRGQGEPKDRSRRTTYFQSDPSVLRIPNDASTIHRNYATISVLKNGNLCDAKGIKIRQKCFVFKNTCLFDALFHGLYAAYCDDPTYASFVDGHTKELPIFEMIATASKKGITAQTYRKRAELLIQLAPTRVQTKNAALEVVDCTLDADVLLQQIFEDFPSCE